MADIEAILKERGKTHGKYEEHAETTQVTKDYWHNTNGWSRLSEAQRETLDMIAHKVGRILSGNPDVNDHWDDIAGYATLASKDIDRRGAIEDEYVEPVDNEVLEAIGVYVYDREEPEEVDTRSPAAAYCPAHGGYCGGL